MESPNSSHAPSLCAGGCGFYGTAENRNMCSKCYNNYLKQEIIAKTAVKFNTSLILDKKIDTHESLSTCADSKEESSAKVDSCSTVKNRCESCNKKVGYIGFACRCGKMFCGMHRYPTEHSCSFDYKEFDRQILVKQNPLVNGDKLEDRV